MPNAGYGLMVGPPPPVQILFAKPESMMVAWDVGGVGYFDSEPLVVPGRYSFPTGGMYRLKLSNIDGREGVERYPTLEVGPITFRTEAYLAHNAIPIQFTDEDFDQVAAGNFVTKVIYLPDPEFQELALAGVETLVSTRLDPGVDPIVEADRRGAILAIIRMGNKDLEMPDAMGNGAGSVMQAGAVAAGYPGCGPANMGACGGMYGQQCFRGDCLPSSGAYPGGVVPYGNVPTYLSGVTVPQWGMPISGTPIGLPGPPHVPLGIQAGLQKHVIRNHTNMSIPEPVRKFRMDVRQQPGYSYPAPPTHMPSASRIFIRRFDTDRRWTTHKSVSGSGPLRSNAWGEATPVAERRHSLRASATGVASPVFRRKVTMNARLCRRREPHSLATGVSWTALFASCSVVLAILVIASSPTLGQTRPYHYFYSADMPPGTIGAAQLMRGGPLPGYFQPVAITGPQETQIAMATDGLYEPPQSGPLRVAMLVGKVYRLKVTNIPFRVGQEVFPSVEIISRLYPPPGSEAKYPDPHRADARRTGTGLARPVRRARDLPGESSHRPAGPRRPATATVFRSRSEPGPARGRRCLGAADGDSAHRVSGPGPGPGKRSVPV